MFTMHYSIYLAGLSFRKTSQRLPQLIKRNHVSNRNWTHHYKPGKMFQTGCKPSEFIIDETLIKVGNGYVCRSVAMEPTDETIPGIRTSIGRSTLAARRFIQSPIGEYGKRSISSDGGTRCMHIPEMLNIIFILRIKKVS
jgi:putative transposase